MFYKTKHKILRTEYIKTLAENVKLLVELREVKGERDSLASVVETYRVKELEAEQALIEKRGPEEESEPIPAVTTKKRTRSRKDTSTTVDL